MSEGCGLLCLFFAVFVGFVWLAAAADKASCEARFSDVETRWGMLSGCQVKTAQGWIPADNFRVF